MTEPDASGQSHRRFNPLRGEWVLVSPQRVQRPWHGALETPRPAFPPSYDPGCYLCPGNTRAGGTRNPDYVGTFVFDNDFSALSADARGEGSNIDDLLVSRPEQGICRVICYSPRHDRSLADMSLAAILAVINCWCEQSRELGARPGINHVQIFENRGEAMGCSNPHPHGQVWAQHSLPSEVARELAHMRRHFDSRGAPLLGDYLALELAREERVVCGNAHFVAVVPFWAVWPFETLLLCRRQVASLPELTAAERQDLAAILKTVTGAYDALFATRFPYSAGVHQAPNDGNPHPEWDLHLHFYPPLLRSATVKKFMVGYEMLAEPQRDLTPERGAALLRHAVARLAFPGD